MGCRFVFIAETRTIVKNRKLDKTYEQQDRLGRCGSSTAIFATSFSSCEEVKRIVYETFNSEGVSTRYRSDESERRKRQEAKKEALEAEIIAELQSTLKQQMLARAH